MKAPNGVNGMINKLALFYNLDRSSIQKIENALVDIATRVQRLMATWEQTVVRVMTLVEGAVDKTPHVTSMGYAPTSLNAFIEFGCDEAPLSGLIQIAGSVSTAPDYRAGGSRRAVENCRRALTGETPLHVIGLDERLVM
jgi:hypothetical protein